jgi:hypothetical protein
MNDFKIINEFVSDQTENFFGDLEDSNKRIKLFTSFSRISLQYENTEMKFTQPKKKFQSKVKIMNKKSNTGIF